MGRTVVDLVGAKRSTWRRWNLHAEASRQLMDVRFTSTTNREAVIGLIVDAAEHGSIRLTPPELASSPIVFQRGDGSSVFRPKHGTLFSSVDLLAAEDRLLELAHTSSGPTLSLATVEKATSKPQTREQVLSDDQAGAVVQISVSGRIVDILVGPAGTGKTTTLGALRKAWEAENGRASVVRLAPSAAAAQVLGDDLGIPTDNTAKWIDAHTHNGWALKAGQLMIVDEASLAGTFTLDTLAAHASQVGAKLLLVGDWAQLSAVDSGGAFGLIARDLDQAPELFDVRRFHNDWEKTASLGLRLGELSVIDTYLEHGRVVDGDLQDMIDAAFTAWRNDLAAGKVSVMIAETVETVRALNERARLDRIITGHVSATGAVDLHDETQAGRGDLVITRKNERKLSTGKAWVKNGDRWIITATHDDGSVTVRRAGIRTGGAVRLPSAYVSEHLELAYAVTAHRAQGSTVDTAHAVVHSSQMTRETFYVAMTRGRDSNTCYVATDQAHLEEHQHIPDNEVTAKAVLAGVLRHEGAEKSAHETIAVEYEAWAGIAQLAAEYETIATVAQRERWVALMGRSGLDTEQVDLVVESESFGPLMAELRRAEAKHHNLDALLPRLITACGLGDADDIGAVLRQRLQRATVTRAGSSRGRAAPRLIAGLIPEARGEMSFDMRAALDERKALIEHRAMTIAETSTTAGEPWTATLGTPPPDFRQRQAWLKQVRVIAAYRDRYGVTDSAPLGQDSGGANQRLDTERARAALQNAQRLGGASPVGTTRRPADRAQQRSQPQL